MRVLIVSLVLVSVAWAQPPVAPAPQTAGIQQGENVAGYNIVDNFETGYRFRTLDGSLAQYRSSVNFGSGIRLLGSFLSVSSRNGRGRWFDQVVVTTQGLGNDPYEAATLRIEKNRLYRYDMLWRQNDYFNPGLVTAGASGQHLLDTRYRMQDNTLTLFPQSNLKFYLGYTGNSQTGPSYSSIQLSSSGDIFPLFSDVRRVWHEYRIGNEFRVLGIRVNWLHGWEDFKDDTGTALAVAGVPGTEPSPPSSGTVLRSFQSSAPYHGTSPYWRTAIFTDRKFFNVNGRFTYTGGQRAFVVDESSFGTTLLGAQNRQVITSGNARRPVATGNLNLSFTPGSKLTVVNSTSLYNVRTEGDSVFSQYDRATQAFTYLNYNFLGIRTVANDTDLNYQISPIWGVMAGYHYSNRRIRSIEQFTFLGEVSTTPSEQTNQLHAGDLGLRVKPWKPLSVLLSAEVGRNDQPFTPKADRDYHVLNGRIQYKTKTLQLTGTGSANYNVNSISLSSYSSKGRTYSIDTTWTRGNWLALDAGFTRMHLYTVGGIAYFLNQQIVRGQTSLYLSNINSVYFGGRFNIKRRADFYLGYTRVQDVGDGRANSLGLGIGSPFPVFEAVQTFPVTFQSPQVRLSVKVNGKLRWNVGYQYYGYGQEFSSAQNYRANTGYTSVSASF